MENEVQSFYENDNPVAQLSKMAASGQVTLPLSEIDTLRARVVEAETKYEAAQKKIGKVIVTIRTINGITRQPDGSGFRKSHHSDEVFNDLLWKDQKVDLIEIYDMEEAELAIHKKIDHDYRGKIDKLVAKNESLIERAEESKDAWREANDKLKEEIRELKSQDRDINKAVGEYKKMNEELSAELTQMEERCDLLVQKLEARGLKENIKAWFDIGKEK